MGDETIVRLLLEKGADVDMTAIDEAISNGHETIRRLLFEKVGME